MGAVVIPSLVHLGVVRVPNTTVGVGSVGYRSVSPYLGMDNVPLET